MPTLAETAAEGGRRLLSVGLRDALCGKAWGSPEARKAVNGYLQTLVATTALGLAALASPLRDAVEPRGGLRAAKQITALQRMDGAAFLALLEAAWQEANPADVRGDGPLYEDFVAELLLTLLRRQRR